jgi:hypothetical protein
MENKKEILLPSKRYKKADEQDLTLNIGLETSQTLLRIGDKDIILDIDKLYDKERNESNKYKIYGKLKMVFRNMYSGDTSYDYLQERIYLNGRGDGLDNPTLAGFLPYDEFAFLRRDLYRKVVTPSSVSGSTLGDYTPSLTYVGSTGHTTITPITAPYHNWNLYLSYVYSGDTNYQMTYTLTGNTKISFKSGDGIPFRLSNTFNSYYEFTAPVEHGMSSGEFVTFSGTTITGEVSGRTYYIDSVGNETYNSEKYVINILKKEFTSGLANGNTMPNLVVGKRCIDKNNITGSTSQYYVHKHKLLTTTGDYIMDNIGFESPIWEEEKKILFENAAGANDTIVERNRMESVLYDFKEPFVLTGLTNNLGYTPTEVYVTTLFKNGNGYFNYPPKVGYKFNFHDTWIDEHFNGTTSNESAMGVGGTFSRQGITFTSGSTLTKGTILNGAFVEYNRKELKERIISESFQKFTNPTTIFDYGQTGSTIFSGSSATNMFGLYYQPHHRVKLRELSPYTESAKTKDIFNLPENTKYDSAEGVWRWRDLYDHGYVDIDGYGTKFPFTNGIHYVKNDINFYLRNERFYTNKQDGISKFKNKKITDC